MAALHLVNSLSGLRSCLTRRAADDVIVLLHDAAAIIDVSVAVKRIGQHAHARGLPASAEDIDYADLVALTEQHKPIVSWR